MIALYPCLEVMFVEWCKNSIRPRLVGRPGFRQKKKATTSGNVLSLCLQNFYSLCILCHVSHRPESTPKQRITWGLRWAHVECTSTRLMPSLFLACVVTLLSCSIQWCHDDDHIETQPPAMHHRRRPRKRKRKNQNRGRTKKRNCWR